MFTRISQRRALKRSLSVLLDRVLLGDLARSTNTPLPVALWRNSTASRWIKAFFETLAANPTAKKKQNRFQTVLLLPVYRCARTTHAILGKAVFKRILDLKHIRLQYRQRHSATIEMALAEMTRQERHPLAPLSVLDVLVQSVHPSHPPRPPLGSLHA